MTDFPTLGIRINNGRVRSWWLRRDLGPATKLYVAVRDTVVIPSPPAVKGYAHRDATWKHGLVVIGYPNGRWKYKKVSCARPQNASGDVPGFAGWKFDTVELAERECARAMNLVTQLKQQEEKAGQIAREKRIQRRKDTRRQELVDAILKADCVLCGAESGHSCEVTEGEMILLDKEQNIMVHAFRIATDIVSGYVESEQIKAQFDGKVPVSLQGVVK